MSICSIEDVAEAVELPFWFQLYIMRDRGFVRELIERAIAAKCTALMPTLDLQVNGERYCDVKNGMTVPPEITLANILDVATKPAWALSVLKGKRRTFGNLAGRIKGVEGVTSLAEWIAAEFDPTLNWRDIEWIRHLARQTDLEGHPRRRGCEDRREPRRVGHRRLQSRRTPT
jgi:L-lactate dehydrogenase (cytochrome)